VWKETPLPKRVLNQTMKLADQNFKSFFKAFASYKKTPSKFKARPKIPSYKDSVKGRFVATYEKGAINKKDFKKGYIKLSGSNVLIKTKVENFSDIKEVKVIPTIYGFEVLVVYEKLSKSLKESGLICSIDLGLNNLATGAFINGQQPFIINGRPLKSINQYYNKEKSKKQSNLTGGIKTSKSIKTLTHKRNNKMNDYLHKASRLLVNHLVSNDVSCLIIGNNKQWKQEINIGSKNNQNFVNIPHNRFIDMLKYKCELEGILVTTTEESYTSKCSFLDLEEVKKHETYKGKRIKRGMFKASNGRMINADVNGAYNIMRKVIPEAFTHEGIEGFAVIPSRMSRHSLKIVI
jgi:putative transposase